MLHTLLDLFRVDRHSYKDITGGFQERGNHRKLRGGQPGEAVKAEYGSLESLIKADLPGKHPQQLFSRDKMILLIALEGFLKKRDLRQLARKRGSRSRLLNCALHVFQVLRPDSVLIQL